MRLTNHGKGPSQFSLRFVHATVVIFFALIGSAQTSHIIRVPVRLVEVPAAVIDSAGKPVRGLTANEFRLLDNGRSQQFRLDSVDEALSIAMAVQNNDAVRTWLPEVRRVRSLIETLLMGATGEASVSVFSDEIKTIQPLTARSDVLDQAFEKVKPTFADKSRTLDALMAAARELEQGEPQRRRVILLIAQAEDIGSTASLPEVIRELELNNIVVYSLVMPRVGSALISKSISLQDAKSYFHSDDVGIVGGLNLGKLIPEIFRAKKTAERKDALTIVTAEMGGRQLSFRSLADLESAISTISEELHTEYTLSYSPNPYDSGYHRIQVEVQRAGAKVRSRPGYYVADSDTRP
ncbi:MAG TPA: VWA domain-containing protein [Bryobacteraceae bacterium]